MREIKFRVWDEDADNPQGKGLKGVMICWDYLKRHPQFFMLTLQKEHDLVPLEYTGLKDSKGKEIYFDDFMSNNFKTDKEVIRQVVLHEGCMMLKRVKGKSSLPKYISLHEWHKLNFEIVGNIKENPDLLK